MKIKSLFFFSALFWIPLFAYAEQPKNDRIDTFPGTSIEKKLFEEGLKKEENKQEESALESFKNSLALCKKSGNDKGAAMNLEMITATLMNQEKFGEAKKWATETLESARKLKNKPKESAFLSTLGKIAAEEKNYTEAEKWYRESLAVDMAIQNIPGSGITCNNIGRALFEEGKYDEAIVFYNRALDIMVFLEDPKRSKVVLGNLRIAEKKRNEKKGKHK